MRQLLEKLENHTGYKVMRTENGQMVAGANSRLKFNYRKGSVIKMPGNGLYLGMNKKYVLDYYSELAEHEVLLTLEFNAKDIVTGNMNDREPEISVKKAVIKNIKTLS